mmetsp:Transcript_24598/g.34373  ORF Transcript_24598/g.34373 Transcript_24598/m.34373 type:complete len:212 (-) Transcript_24598:5068-5703(-)
MKGELNIISWKIMKDIECCFRIKKELLYLCKLKENLSGYCKKAFCPLIQKDYAFVERQGGKIYLFTKNYQGNLQTRWLKYRLSENFIRALEQLETVLYKWPKYFLHFNKTKLAMLFDFVVSKNRIQSTDMLFTNSDRKKKNKIINKVLIKRQNNYDMMSKINKELLKRLKSGFYGNVFYNMGTNKRNFKVNSEQSTNENKIKSSKNKINLL